MKSPRTAPFGATPIGKAANVRVIGHGLGSSQLERQIGPILRDRRQNKPVESDPFAGVTEPDSSCPRPPVTAPSVRTTASVKAPLRLIPPLCLKTHARVRTTPSLCRCRPSHSLTLCKSSTTRAIPRRRTRLRLASLPTAPRRNGLNPSHDVLVDRGDGGFQAAQHPRVTTDANSHAYAYSASSDKATKATLADKIGRHAAVWTTVSRRSPTIR